MVPFHLNPNQQQLMIRIREQYRRRKMIRATILKSRRVGMSSLTEALLFVHCLARANAHAKIVAHLAATSEDLFRVPRDLAYGMPFPIGDIQTKRIFFNHPAGRSRLDVATAGTPSAGRGATLSALHLSEAAQFPGEDSFLSLLPSVSEGPDTIVVVESTAFGMEGLGESFYNFWNSSVEGRSGYLPVFLSWLDDPACQRAPDEAADAPSTREERELMRKPYNATRPQIAWMRRTLEDKCQGMMQKFMQEYPWCPEVAFVSTGDPAFTEEEKIYARSTLLEPLWRGTLRRLSSGASEFVESSQGMLHLWEKPVDPRGAQRTDRYYIGADAALGREEGDFSAYAILNGTTGELVGRFADRIHPEALADQLDLAGRWFNRALINVELTGNLGRITQKRLRDDYRYSNLYTWKGKDDRKPGRHKSVVIGWETTQYSRRLLYDTFRMFLRAGMHNELGGLVVRDEALMSQMKNASLYEGWSWEVRRGHDDILFANMLAVIACSQYPPSRLAGANRKPDYSRETIEQLIPAVPDVADELKKHWREVMHESKQSTQRCLFRG